MANEITVFKDKNLTKGIGDVNIFDEIPEFLTKDEVNQIIMSVPRGKHSQVMFISFLWNTGVRVTEAISVKKGDIDFTTMNIKIHWLKKRKRQMRILPVNKSFMYKLSLYTSSMNLDDRIFNFSRQRAFKIVKDAVNGSGIEKNVSNHTFRHSFAVHYYNHTKDIVGLKRLLGHAHISSTMIYAKIASADIRDNLNKIEW